MTAQEMFESLNFDEPTDEGHYIYYENSYENCRVIFYNYDKTVCVLDMINYQTINVSMPLFKAIEKQLEELRWI